MNMESEFFKDFTFDEFCEKYFPILVTLVQVGNIPKDGMRKTITKLISFQTIKTKENLMKEMPKRDTDRKLVNWLVRAVELYRSKAEYDHIHNK